MPKLSQEEISTRIFNNSKGRLQLISNYQGRNYNVILHCIIHNLDFEVSGDAASRNPLRCNCPECTKSKIQEKNKEKQTELQCAYCGKKFFRANSKLENSKSGLYFCCREHKDLAQKINSGEQFNSIRPEHYGIGINNYRQKAFQEYPHQCAICGWNEDEDVLQVHHIDENRQNGNLNNLIILCPNCHQKLTIHKYKLVNRKEIVLNNT